ncbi:macrophage mannose receptor 1-like [Cydia pomonella]|uniref:macrophage mannose receptor 1-like n=1 Tax=Cydia pomonella TaxID=82600 RepID=UPI002ADDD2D3|nr:macrophage mannose receptor 1-like [Cydia pomonella]
MGSRTSTSDSYEDYTTSGTCKQNCDKICVNQNRMFIVKMIKLGKLLCAILFVGTHYAAGAPNSGYQYSREVNAWLRLHMVPATWAEAGMRCLLEGAVLASPTTNAMAQVMVAMMDDHKLTYSVFTGINSILVRENFTSLEGLPVSSIPVSWADGQPDNDNTDEDCLVLTSEGKLADMSCESMLPYFCRKEDKCGATKAKGYKWEPRTGSCYKYHEEFRMWRDALATCHAEGGHLTTINHNIESTVLKEIFSGKIGNYAFVGILHYNDDVWATINGEMLSDFGFLGWAKGEPNNVNENEFCGSIYHDGLLNDVQCHQSAPFICEFTPKN